MSDTRFIVAAGDVPPRYEATIDDSRHVVTFENCEDLTFSLWPSHDTTAPVYDAVAALIIADNPAGGLDVAFAWPAGVEQITRGLYLARWRATFADGSIVSFPSDRYDLIAFT